MPMHCVCSCFAAPADSDATLGSRGKEELTRQVGGIRSSNASPSFPCIVAAAAAAAVAMVAVAAGAA